MKVMRAADNILMFANTLRAEVDAYSATLDEHDRKRALKAVAIMEKHVAGLKATLEHDHDPHLRPDR